MVTPLPRVLSSSDRGLLSFAGSRLKGGTLATDKVCRVAVAKRGREVGRARRLLKDAGIPSIAWPSRRLLPYWDTGPFAIYVSPEHRTEAEEILHSAGFAEME